MSANTPSSTSAFAALTNQSNPATPASTQQAQLTQNLTAYAVAANSGQAAPRSISSNPFAAIQQLVSSSTSSQSVNSTTPFQVAQSLGSTLDLSV